MTVTKSRGATKKLGPISVGSKVVRFKVPNIDRRFTVHEDLICQTSRFFSTRLQKARKQACANDECCVCTEALNPTTKDLTFCHQCGQNMHELCLEAWKRTATSTPNPRTPRPPPTHQPNCPMCRAPWKNDPLLTHLVIDHAFYLDAESLQLYLDWLYSARLCISAQISRKTDAFNLVVLKLWGVATAVQDDAFKAVVVSTFFEEARARFWTESVQWAFVLRRCEDEVREFILEVSLVYIEPGWFAKEAGVWPSVFVRQLADVAMVNWAERKSFGELKKVWLDKLGGVGEEAEVVEEEEEEEEGEETIQMPT
ncbi:hypothetical protein BDW02DRAFT_604131 [Decorospora gaudefroyi]|uniref:RING-type domain-containing protein n=1 Tax=Decorospora gaudefroyi TaxID=184978 RepID=A0A6A5KW58_9PLEO|nr:hypothetical protein BDW02DRAFT_604131 [Decorospora gaudefroyi]